MLFGACVPGLTLTYVAQPETHGGRGLTAVSVDVAVHDLGSTSRRPTQAERGVALSFEHAYAHTVGPPQQYLLPPLFFATIGCAIVSVRALK